MHAASFAAAALLLGAFLSMPPSPSRAPRAVPARQDPQPQGAGAPEPAAQAPGAQDPGAQDPRAQAPGAQDPNPPAAADVASIDALVGALYDVISGPAGAARDWGRMRSLFHPEARLVPILAAEQGVAPRWMSVDDYVRRFGPYLEQNGFFEREIARREERYGDLVHVWSTYEARRAADGEPFLRGINSIQLVRTRGRWAILHVVWEAENEAGPLPDRYLPGK